MAMQFASAYYVAQPSVEILVFIDEEASELPEGAALIIETKESAALLKAVEPYFILGSS